MNWLVLSSTYGEWLLQITPVITFLLAVAACIGYVLGRKRGGPTSAVERARLEVRRAHAIARELERIAGDIRKNLTEHHGSVARFRERVEALGADRSEATCKQLCREAEEILRPTLALASQIARAYDDIRQQGNHLMTFSEVRTDALTGVSNRRALDESLISLHAMHQRYNHSFAIAIFDIDHFKKINDVHGHVRGDQTLQRTAAMLDELARETDVVARYGGEEFVVVMPATDVAGANRFAERVRTQTAKRLGITISGGVAQSKLNEQPVELLHRADQALYEAKRNGRNRIYYFAMDGEIQPAERPEESPVQEVEALAS